MYTRLLLPTDGSQVSWRAVAHAEGLARATGAAIVVLEVIESRHEVMRRPSVAGWLPSGDGIVTDDQADQLIAAQRRAAENHLASVREALDRGQIPDVRQRIVEGQPGPTIVGTANEERCDGIVMSTHGRTGLSRLFLGSVAEYVLRHAPCPVILVPAPERLAIVRTPRSSARNGGRVGGAQT